MNTISPLAKKIQIKPGKRWLFYNAPESYLSLIEPLPDGVEFVTLISGNFDGVQLFALDSSSLGKGLTDIASLLTDDLILWITYPKKTSGIQSDLWMMGNWDEPAKYGLRSVAAASVDETWTAIRFRFEGLSKLSSARNEEIRKNEYAAYIDVDNKQVLLPPDMQHALSQSTEAMSFYQELSYSNKKEYVIWILSAKQEKTKNERLMKLVEKLLSKKKNPSEK